MRAFEVLLTFLIALIPHGRRCPRLIKAKALDFLTRIMKNASYHSIIDLNALQEDAPTPATAAKPFSPSLLFPKSIRVAKIVVLKAALRNLYCGFLRILSAHQGAIIFLVRIACLLVCSYCGKYVQVFPRWALRPCY